ncbi:uncharacterized protein LOC132066524 [Lycium ferocissimum]|uniref:uncharacterized protein LOC132066524 n=1 Tax=Lycium ferocissimum TaxID=112874 RepID=UPI002814FEC6|nr:uncharacterized protein LOC132066524 [Lycium ferocissimum]
MCNNEKYVLPDCIFTCATLSHLKLSRCIFKLPDGTQFPNLVSLQLEHSECFNVNRIFKRIKHLSLDGSSLKNLGSVHSLDVVLNLQSLLYDLKISVKRISYALCLLRNSPKLYEIDIDEVVKVDETARHTTELFDYLSKTGNEVSEALNMIQTVRLRKFKGTSTEMYLIKVILAHSPKLARMVIEQIEESNELLKDLISYHRASPNAEIKYT